jgi:hypothetical protein
MSVEQENADVLACIEVAAVTLDRARWTILDPEARRSREASLQMTATQVLAAARALRTARRVIKNISRLKVEVPANAHRS